LTLAPLLDASPIIRLHAAFAFAAIGLGAVQLLAPKGTLPHRTIGWAWALLMILVAGSSFFIHTIRTWGPWTLRTVKTKKEPSRVSLRISLGYLDGAEVGLRLFYPILYP
jgi:hypothetical protein